MVILAAFKMGTSVAAVALATPMAPMMLLFVASALLTFATASAGSPKSSTLMHESLCPSTPPAALMTLTAPSQGPTVIVPKNELGPEKEMTSAISRVLPEGLLAAPDGSAGAITIAPTTLSATNCVSNRCDRVKPSVLCIIPPGVVPLRGTLCFTKQRQRIRPNPSCQVTLSHDWSTVHAPLAIDYGEGLAMVMPRRSRVNVAAYLNEISPTTFINNVL